jgi:hypothetical protein
MQVKEQYKSTVSRCETAARNRGHILGVWQHLNEMLHATMCENCGEMVWVTRSGDERRWRMGGEALEQECIEGGATTVVRPPSGA